MSSILGALFRDPRMNFSSHLLTRPLDRSSFTNDSDFSRPPQFPITLIPKTLLPFFPSDSQITAITRSSTFFFFISSYFHLFRSISFFTFIIIPSCAYLCEFYIPIHPIYLSLFHFILFCFISFYIIFPATRAFAHPGNSEMLPKCSDEIGKRLRRALQE